MKITIVFHLDHRTRRALGERIGLTRPANYGECRTHLGGIVEASLQVTVSEYDADQAAASQRSCPEKDE